MIYLLKIVIFVDFLVCKPLNKRWKGSVTKGPQFGPWRTRLEKQMSAFVLYRRRSNGELRHQSSRSCPYHVVTGGVHLILQRRYSRVSIELPLLFQCRLMAVHGPIVMSVTAPLKDGPTQHACQLGRAKDVENSFPMKLQETELRTPDFPISIILPSLGSLSTLKLNEWSDLSNQHGYASKTRLLVDPKCLSFSYLGWFHKWWYPVPPIAGWFILENPTKMDDNWGTPYFRKPPFNQLAIFRACKFEPFPVLVGATSICGGL